MVLRLKVKSGGYNDWLVSTEGTLYLGEGYSSSRLSLLPSLTVPSASLKRTEDGSGFEPLKEVSQSCSTFRFSSPGISCFLSRLESNLIRFK